MSESRPDSRAQMIAWARRTALVVLTTAVLVPAAADPEHVRRGTAAGAELAGDNQVRAAIWDDNDIVLWPGESQVLTASYRVRDLGGTAPVVSVSGWNTGRAVVAAPRAAQ